MKEVKVADVKISELPAFSGSIDPTNDELPIVNDSDDETQRINRNTFLNLASQPLGLTDTQSPTNKTFDNTNTVTLKDTLFTLQDDGNTTKQVKFQLSGITASTTRTLTVPDANTTIVGTDATQTLTNKTLTSPTINTATIVNPTITVDSIAEYTSAHGVTVDGLNIKDGALNTNNSVVTANVTDSAITPAKLFAGTGTGWSWQSYSPTITNLTVGNGTLTAKYIQTGKTVFGCISMVFGNSSSISGALSFTLPVTSVTYGGGGGQPPLGSVRILDSGTAAFTGQIYWASTTTANIQVQGASGTYVNLIEISSTVPMTWTQNDTFALNFTYEAA